MSDGDTDRSVCLVLRSSLCVHLSHRGLGAISGRSKLRAESALLSLLTMLLLLFVDVCYGGFMISI